MKQPRDASTSGATNELSEEFALPIVDPTERREYHRQWIAKRRADYMTGKSCVQCGSTKDLEVDHIDPEQKISHRIWSWSAERRNAELSKCQILCSECHLAKTVASYAEIPHGTVSRYTSKRYKCRCDLCRAANAKKKADREAKLKSEAAAQAQADLALLANSLEHEYIPEPWEEGEVIPVPVWPWYLANAA